MSRTCAIPACSRNVKPGRIVCFDHRHTREGEELIAQLKSLSRELIRLTTDASLKSAPSMGHHRVRVKVNRGDYIGLLQPTLAQLAEVSQRTNEIWRLIGISDISSAYQIATEPDPYRMGTIIARNVNNVTNLMRLLHNESREVKRRNR